MLFYICACFLTIGGIIQVLFVQNLERKKRRKDIQKDVLEHPHHIL